MTRSRTRGGPAGICAVVALVLAFLPAQIGWAEQNIAVHSADVVVQARLLRANGSFDEAITILRSALRRDPRNVALREELGYALLLDGQMATAQYQFEILEERNRDPALGALYRSVLNRIARERPVGINLIFGFTPTDNVNQGTDNTTINSGVLGTGVIDPANRRISGWQSRIGLSGYVRAAPSPSDLVVFDWRIERQQTSEQRMDETEAEIGLALRHFSSTGEMAARFFYQYRARDPRDVHQPGFSLFRSYNLDRARQINGRLQLSYLNVEGRNVLDGPRMLVDAGYVVTRGPSLAMRFGAQLERAQARAKAQRFTSVAATLQVSTAFKGGLEITGQALAGRREFDEALRFARHDTFADVSVTVFNSQFSYRGFVPKLTCRIRSTSSNVALFDSTTRECGMALSRRF